MSRDHAKWSASATLRNWLCPGSIVLAEEVVRSPESKAAAWGTACHILSEQMLTAGDMLPLDIGDQIETERFTFTIDVDMMECANAYVDYIINRLKEGCELFAVEQSFSLESMGLPMAIGGIADCVLYSAQERLLEIVDLKTGKGHFVDAIGNPQERLYALGVLNSLDLKGMPVDLIRTTIVQPRLNNAAGTIRSETMQFADLADWVIDLMPRVSLAAQATHDYSYARENSVMLDNWVETYLSPGEEQCTFCPAAGGCPALRKQALGVTGLTDYEPQLKSNAFAENSVEQVEADLDRFEQLEAWIRERRALAHEMAVQGHHFDHWHLVDRIGHRKFSIPENDLIREIMRDNNIGLDQLYDRKLKSPAGMEKSLGKKFVEEKLGDFIIRPVTGTDLIRATNVTRTPRDSLVDRFFIEQE